MLKFIGSGSAFNTELGNNGAYIKKDNILFMIDCGSSTFDRLMKSNLLDGVERIYVLLTHTHPDHVGSLGDLIFYGYYAMGEMMKPSVSVITPYGMEINNLLERMGVQESLYKLLESNIGTESMEISDGDFEIKITPIPAQHVKELPCYGYIIGYEIENAYYSGDSNHIPHRILRHLHNGYYDYFYQDTCIADYEGNVHLSLRKLDELVDHSVRSKVYCMHLDNGFDIEKAKGMGFGVVKNYN